MVDQTETEAVAELARASAFSPAVVEHEGRKFLTLPEGFRSEDITDPFHLQTDPLGFVRQGVTLQDTASLIAYVERFKTPTTVLMADIGANRVAALIDYHAPPGPTAHAGTAAAVTHRATMTIPFSEEWKLWSGISGKLMPQEDFARFVEENAPDVVAPTGAELLEVARDLRAVRAANFTKAVRTSGDIEKFEYVETTDARSRNGDVEIPTKFELGIPVYFNGRSIQQFAFLRWKLADASLTIGIQLHRAEHVRQSVFKEIVDQIGQSTGCPVLYGALDTARPTP